MSKEKKTIRWTEYKKPSELEAYLMPDEDWSKSNKHFKGVILDTVMGVWDDFYIVECTDGSIRRVNVKEVTDG